MGTIELFHGDCLEVMKELPDRSIDLFLCDLPYGVLDKGGSVHARNYAERTDRPRKDTYKMFDSKEEIKFGKKCGKTYGTSNAWDVVIPWEPFWTQVKRLRKNAHSVVLFFCQGKFMADAICTNKDEFRLALVWDKKVLTNFFDANRRPCYNHEQILVFAEKSAFYHRVNYEGKCPTTIIRSDNLSYIKCRGARYHPTEKPIDLYKRLVSWYCPPGGTMLDPTAGSCNSIIAAGQTGRNAIGIEKNEGYFNKGLERIEALALATP
jgi:DNA modification methylase